MSYSAVFLGLCQFLFKASVSVCISFNGLVGENLAPSPDLATLPYLFITASTAALTLILPRVFATLGYQGGFIGGALMGLIGFRQAPALLVAMGRSRWHWSAAWCWHWAVVWHCWGRRW